MGFTLGPSQPQPGAVLGVPPRPKVRTLRSGSHIVPMDTGQAPRGWEGHRAARSHGAEAVSAQQTYIGSILVSVNPYRMFGIYGLEQVHQYSGRALGENPP